MTISGLPEVLQEIADVAGIDAAWALADSYGGTTVFLPAKIKPSHWLAAVVGLESAEKIVAYYRVKSGGERWAGINLTIPMGSAMSQARRWEEVLSAGELSLTETARLMHVHERTVSRRRAAHGHGASDDEQGKLF